MREHAFTITPIGSCRIATPLRMAQQRHNITVNRARSYGFCHTAAEAVQQAAFLSGAFAPPAALWPLLAREADQTAMTGAVHIPSDLYLVEISSAKQIMIDGISVQLNYLNSHFSTFFGDEGTAREFWARARQGQQARIDRLLVRARVAAPDADILRRIRIEAVTDAALRRDIRHLIDTLPRVAFITHVSSPKADGLPIASRVAFSQQVQAAARAEGAEVFDPTDLVRSLGPRFALSDHDGAMAHYTDDFSCALADDWVARFANEHAGQPTPPHDTSDQAEVARRALVMRQPGAARAAMLEGAHSFRGDLQFADAFADFTLDHGATAVADLPHNTLAQLAMQMPRRKGLLFAAVAGDPLLAQQDIAAIGVTDLTGMLGVMQLHGMDIAGARLARTWLAAQSPAKPQTAPVWRFISGWLQGCAPDLSCQDKVALLRAAQAFAPDHSATRRFSRALRADVLARTKSHAEAGDLEALDTLADTITPVMGLLPEIALAQARLHFDAGAYEVSMALGQIAAERWPRKLSVRVMLMRSAKGLGDQPRAASFARDVIAQTDKSSARLEREAQTLLQEIGA
jgi:hypothetical protein